METLPQCTESRALPARPVSAQENPELPPQEISTLLTRRHETTDEELELIEMRYRHWLALTNLEDLFAEGKLDWS